MLFQQRRVTRRPAYCLHSAPGTDAIWINLTAQLIKYFAGASRPCPSPTINPPRNWNEVDDDQINLNNTPVATKLRPDKWNRTVSVLWLTHPSSRYAALFAVNLQRPTESTEKRLDVFKDGVCLVLDSKLYWKSTPTRAAITHTHTTKNGNGWRIIISPSFRQA